MAKNIPPNIKLNNGYEIPVIGLGTYLSNGTEVEKAVKQAIDEGYRHIDTAYFYQNESEIGKAVKDKIAEGVIKREEIFVTTKLWCHHHDPDQVERAARLSLTALDLGYIDLYLMHFPAGLKFVSDADLFTTYSDVDYLDTWKAMEKLVKLGIVRSIGVSNFNSEQIERLLKHCEIKPVTNQVETHPNLNQKKLIAFCKERDIVVTAYSPLAKAQPEQRKPDFLFDSKTISIGKKYNKTAAQVVLRYLIQLGAIVIPKSVTPSRITENFDIFDFELSQDDVEILDEFNNGARVVSFLEEHKYYPFNIEF